MTRQADSIQLMATPHTLRRRLVVPSTTCAALGERRLPHELQFQNTTVGGLSGVDYDPASGGYCLPSDETSASARRVFALRRLLGRLTNSVILN